MPIDLSNAEELAQLNQAQLIALVQDLYREKQEYEKQKNKILKELRKAIQDFLGDINIPPFDAHTSLTRGIKYALGLMKRYIDVRFEELDLQKEMLLQEIDAQIKKTLIREANLSSLINNTNDFIFSVNKNYQILTINRAYKEYLKNHYDLQLEEGDSLKDKIRKKVFEYWYPFYEQAFRGETFKKIEKRTVGKEFFVYEVSFNPIIQKDSLGNEEVTGAALFIRDITKEYKTEEKIKEQNRELKAINAELDTFAYSLSHDLKAPLASVLGIAHLIRLEEANETILNYVGMIEKSVQKLMDFITELTDFMKNKQTAIKKENVLLLPMVQELVESLQYIEKNKSIQTHIHIAPELTIYTDSMRLQMILTNLISNAFRYMNYDQEQPCISIIAQETPKKWVIQVIDNGIGIAKEHQRKIFNMFYRATNKVSGTGLGLYIVKEACQKIGAKIKLYSELNKGSTFTIEIPIQKVEN
ncbi:MAG: PAS domain-containing sensor histidine kinase [Microscillaceae bacterium]|nr:PAS domain-containing sensor histidine kinase [Microscillaceae bacterium]MDW8460514.1 PAS domain-containing sensor histidine kinase [Cytophagales bacterium]